MQKKRKPDFSKPLEKKRSESLVQKATDEQRDKLFANCPVVVIAGRPNVGKSTLFNRFMKKNIAITDPTPGVTRDPVEGTALIAGKPVRLIDTGGYKLERKTGTQEAVLDELVVNRSLDAIRKADLILLVFDAKELTAEDEELIGEMRPYRNKVVAVVNKTEGGRNREQAYDYARFGFGDLILDAGFEFVLGGLEASGIN